MIKRFLSELKSFHWKIIKVMSISRAWNFIGSFIERMNLKPVAKTKPAVIMIEPTNKCNLRCPMCPAVIEGSLGKRPDMSLELFRQIVEDASSHAFYLALWNYGEPLINQDIEKMLACASRSKYFVEMHTNGQLLNLFTLKVFQQNKKQIPHHLPDKMSISVDSISEKTYRHYRKGGELSKLKFNIQDFVTKRDQYKVSKPWIVVQFIMMKNNAEEIEKNESIKTFANDMMVDDYTVKYFSYRGENKEEHLPENKQLRLKLQNERKKITPCLRPWTSTLILSDGTVIPCCYDYRDEWPLGNLKEKSFNEIWNDKPYQEFRSMLLSGNEPIICKNCPGRDFGILFK